MNELVAKSLFVMQQVLTTMQKRAAHAQRGQGLVEYVLILAFMALLVVVAMKLLQPAIAHTITTTTCNLNSAGVSTPPAGATPCP